LATGQDDLYDSKLSKESLRELSHVADGILSEVGLRFPELRAQVDFFTMETALCSFKKIFREHHGRYLGYYLDRQAEEIRQCEADGWYGIDWSVLWQAREEVLDPRLTDRHGIRKEKFASFLETGRMERLEWLFPDESSWVNPVGLDKFWS
jgi:hypothetical protein